jgi:hypothetical protein
MKLPLLFLAALCATTGACVSDVDEEEVDETEEALKNTSISETKICVRVKRDTMLYLHPTDTQRVDAPSKFGPKLLAAGPRYVLVQRKPGRVEGRVWVDADLYGLRSDEERDALAKRCGISRAAATKAVEVAQANEYVRRGWVDVDDLTGNLRKNLAASSPNGTGLREGDRDSEGDLKEGSIRTVKQQCLIQGAYRGSSNTRASGLATYGTCAQWREKADGDVECTTWGNGMYINYGTPEIDGGGISFAYLPVGEKVHYLRSHVHEQRGDHCQVDDDVDGVRCNGASPKPERDRRIWWAEVWARTAGRTIRGWVPKDCLTP